MRECDDEYPWLGEFLTEYVDGTMSPAARAAFEECLRGNPALTAFVARLRMTRNVLCDYGCDVHAPCNLREQLHARLRSEGLIATDAVVTASPTEPSAASHALPGLRTTLLLVACAMGAALFVARTDLEPGRGVAGRTSEDRLIGASPSVAVPISARLPYGEPRPATRADSVQRARQLAEAGARRDP